MEIEIEREIFAKEREIFAKEREIFFRPEFNYE